MMPSTKHATKRRCGAPSRRSRYRLMKRRIRPRSVLRTIPGGVSSTDLERKEDSLSAEPGQVAGSFPSLYPNLPPANAREQTTFYAAVPHPLYRLRLKLNGRLQRFHAVGASRSRF